MPKINFSKIKSSIKPLNICIKISLILLGIILYAIALKWFVSPANILPTGLTGLSYLLQRIIHDHTNVLIPITVFNVSFNIIPAIVSFLIVGKYFTIVSFIILVSFSFVADLIPYVNLTTDPMICAIFGGILIGFGSSLWFRCGTSGGGADFIAMTLSTKLHIQTFTWIMAFNITLTIVQGILYGWTYSFYTIIFQFFSNQALTTCYRHYEARTIFIITNEPEKIAASLIQNSGHSATMIKGIGSFTKQEKTMLYTVITQPELRKIINIIKKEDPQAFLNVVRSSEIQGNFSYLPVSKDIIDTYYGDK